MNFNNKFKKSVLINFLEADFQLWFFLGFGIGIVPSLSQNNIITNAWHFRCRRSWNYAKAGMAKTHPKIVLEEKAKRKHNHAHTTTQQTNEAYRGQYAFDIVLSCIILRLPH